jgi:hypothetical protein
LYKLQEEALLKDAVKKTVEKVIPTVKVETRKPKPATPPSNQEILPKFPEFVLAPVKTLPTSYELILHLPPMLCIQALYSLSMTFTLKLRDDWNRKMAAAFLLLAS